MSEVADGKSRCFLWVFGALISVSYIARIFIAFNYQVNWDEFFYLSKIYAFQSGTLSSVLQSIYVHLFSWLTYIPGNEVDQVVVGRLVMLLIQGGTMWLVFQIARDLLGASAAAFSIVGYATFSFVIIHGASFRADPLVGFLMVWALYLIYMKDPNVKVILGVSLLVSLATMVSVKSIILMPVLALVALVKLIDGGSSIFTMVRYASMIFMSVGLFSVFYALHYASLNAEVFSVTKDKVLTSYTSAIIPDELFPRWGIIRNTFVTDMFYYFLVMGGLIAACVSLLRPVKRLDRRATIVIILAIPLASLVFYKNAYPYFFPYILPTVSVLAGYVWYILSSSSARLERNLILAWFLTIPWVFFFIDRNILLYVFPYILPTVLMLTVLLSVVSKLGVKPEASLLIPIALMLASFRHVYRDGLDRAIAINLDTQKQMLSVIHDMFPDPVPYVDGSSMVASFPKTGFFMSSWGLEEYFDKGNPLLSRKIREAQPKFVLLNTSSATLERVFAKGVGLLSEDVHSLRENYIHHWGGIYIAGKSFHLEPGEVRRVELVVSGPYTVESSNDVKIGGRLVKPSDVIELSVGFVELESFRNSTSVVLRYGEHIYRPHFEPLSDRLYNGF